MIDRSDPAPRRIRPPARTAALLGLLVVAAFTIRFDALRNDAIDVPQLGDARAYHLLAENLAEGRGYIRPYEYLADGSVYPTAEYPPGLPAVLAVGYELGATTETSQRMLLCGVGALTVGLVGLIGRRLGGDGAGYLAAAIAAIHPAMFNVDVTLMAEPLAAFTGAGLVLAALAVLDRPSLRRWLAFGVLVGLGCFVRSEFVLVGPGLALLVAWQQRGTAEAPADRGVLLRSLGASMGMAVLVLLPWTIRNYAAFGQFVPLSNNAGSVSRGANCDAAYQGQFRGLWVTNVSLGAADEDQTRAGCFSGFDVGPERNEAEASAELRSDGLAYLREHRSELPAVVAARIGRTVGLYQFDQQSNFAFAEGRSAVWERRGTRVFQLLAVVGLAGLAFGGWRHRDRLLLLVPPVAVLITVALTYGNPRFRATAEPAVVVLAALAITDLARRVQAAGR